MVRLVYECGGCDAKAEGAALMSKTFLSVSGKSHGFGSWAWRESPDDLRPEGWVAADPVTACCYCPKCWEAIMYPTADEFAESIVDSWEEE